MRNFLRAPKPFGIFIVGMMLVTSCQRSPQFRKEDDYGRNDFGQAPSGPSKLQGVSVTQKVEAIGQPKKRVAIFNFWNDTPVKQSELGSYAADELRRGLFLSQRVTLSDNSKGEFNSEDFVQGEQVKVAQLIREGRKLGVAILIIGRIYKIVFRQRGDEVGIFRQKQSLAAVQAEIKLFDVQAGREIKSNSRSGEATAHALVALEGGGLESPAYRAELIRFAMREAVAGFVLDILKAIEKMAWQGRIAKITGTKIYVNAGRASGLLAGDILRVMNPGDDIYDSVSGAFLGRSQGQLKGTLEVVDFMGTDGAVTEVHTGGNFREGDSVQLY